MSKSFWLTGRSKDRPLPSSTLAGAVCRVVISATIGVLLSVAGSDATAQQQATYSYTPVSFPSAVFTVINGVNRAGDIVGTYRDAASTHMHGFLRRDGKFTSIEYPGAESTAANGISPSGDVVGQYSLPDTPNVAHGFVLTKQGRFTSVNVPGHTSTVAVRLLSDGTILGCYHDQGPPDMHGMKFVGGKLSDLDRPFSMHRGATPDGKTIVGTYNDRTSGKSHNRSYVLTGSTFTPFDAPGSSATSVSDINAAGTIVGTYEVNGINHGFVREREVYTTLNVPGAVSTSANGISDDGTVVGASTDASGATRGFIATRK
jgi:uncharacterized membrane protein